jgi:putative transposase
MKLNDLWNIVDQFIQSIPEHFPHVEIHEFVVMPNHVHLLLIMGELRDDRRDDPSGRPLNTGNRNDNVMIGGDSRTTQCIVPTTGNPWKHKPKPWISPKSWSLSAIIGSFKSTCTREINKQSTEWKINIPYWDTFARQPRYHDHIVRNEESYNKIKYYIQTNPQHRESDTFNR